ncbi:hypothetical protein BGLT_00802 [Caballeronia glathei]|jgi:hypothetical protein|nr:hypothetical protein B0G84_6822 [Paraburkholderia sp. BL8N3]CDY77651.1 hypothetical protein BGLT_00802 [Caballeronia glathei]
MWREGRSHKGPGPEHRDNAGYTTHLADASCTSMSGACPHPHRIHARRMLMVN